MSRKVIITCAVTGAIHTPSMSKALPVTAQEIADAAIGAAEAGAAIVHLHARNPETGQPDQTPEAFAPFLKVIKQRSNCVVNLTTGGAPTMRVEERVRPAAVYKPEVASLNMGSMNFGLFGMLNRFKDFKHEWERQYLGNKDIIFRNTYQDIEYVLRTLADAGTRFEFECYDTAHLYNLNYFLEQGLVKPPLFVQTVFGLQGGTLADVMPKRWALFLGLALQSVLCFFVPLKLGAGVWQLIMLLFLMSAISQVTTPAMKSAVRLVTTAAQVAAVSALVALLGSLGAAIGSSFLAPMIIRYSTIQMVMYSAGGVLGIAAIGALQLPSEPKRTKKEQKEESQLFREAMVTPRRIASWVTAYPTAASMVLVGALVVALFAAINSLLPVYVREVLHTDPTLSVYIFAPAGVGFIIGTILSPQLIRIVGERWVAAMSFFFIAGGAILLGSIHVVAQYIANYSPLRVVEVAGKSLDRKSVV